jgi:hypothetical protein
VIGANVDNPEMWDDLSDDDADMAFAGFGTPLSCFCHSLQLVVRDALQKTTHCRLAMAKITKLANLCHKVLFSDLTSRSYLDVNGQFHRLLKPDGIAHFISYSR